MRKKDELSREHTCMQHAHPNEMTFVLLSRDAAAPAAIRAWAAERIRLGKNTEDDAQITEALACACTMENEGRHWVDAVRLAPHAESWLDCPDCRALSKSGHEPPRCDVFLADERAAKEQRK